MEDTPINQTHNALKKLYLLVKTLRGENGCPWDKKQTPESVGIYLIEEVFELVDAIDSGSAEQVREELGDVLFHIVFIASMFEERDAFDLSGVARTITEKMIRRHPHVFGDKEVNSSAEVIQNWHKIKLEEKKGLKSRSLLDSVPPKLPALIRAYRVSDRVAKSGFEWTGAAGNQNEPEWWAPLLQELMKKDDRQAASRKIGDLLFALINIARLADIHPERALAGAIKNFEAKFKMAEELIAESQRELSEVPAAEKIRIWKKVNAETP
jgi:tetrapyrrole methylase family protein/MazG family protein